jgi:hypothetical protein
MKETDWSLNLYSRLDAEITLLPFGGRIHVRGIYYMDSQQCQVIALLIFLAVADGSE